MAAPDTIQLLPAGAAFLRGDLHIHPTQASHDVKDPDMTPARIVAEAAKEGLSLIAISSRMAFGCRRSAPHQRRHLSR